MDQAGLTSLQAEIAALDTYLLSPITTVAPDPMSDDGKRAIAAYIVLAHSALETFLEACFHDFACHHLRIDAQNRVPVGMYQSLVKFGPQISKQLAGDAFRPAKILQTLPVLIKKHVIDQNDGIKSSNLKVMAHACGVDWVELETVCAGLLPALDTLGVTRGTYAHASLLTSTTAPRQPALQPERYPAEARAMVADVTGRLPDLVSLLGNTAPQRPSMTWRTSLARASQCEVRDLRRWWGQRPFRRRSQA